MADSGKKVFEDYVEIVEYKLMVLNLKMKIWKLLMLQLVTANIKESQQPEAQKANMSKVKILSTKFVVVYMELSKVNGI